MPIHTHGFNILFSLQVMIYEIMSSFFSILFSLQVLIMKLDQLMEFMSYTE
jgi:hypothetical protein